jgi:hypothetical protein
MSSIKEIEARRGAILEEMLSIRSMKRGSITKQYLKVPQKGKQPERRGPYYVFSRQEKGRTVSNRITSAAELEQAHQDLEAHTRFVRLCKEYEALTERLMDLERDTSKIAQEKKQRK